MYYSLRCHGTSWVGWTGWGVPGDGARPVSTVKGLRGGVGLGGGRMVMKGFEAIAAEGPTSRKARDVGHPPAFLLVLNGTAEAAPLQSKVEELSFSAGCEGVLYPKPAEDH